MPSVRDDAGPVVGWDDIDRVVSGHGGLEDISRRLAWDLSDEHFRRLAVTVEAEIVPRLMLMYGEARAAAESRIVAAPPITPDEVAALTRFVLEPDAGPALFYLTSLLTRGARVESILLELLTPVARRLGEMWDEDVHSFVEVTTGLARLQQLLRIVGSTVGTLGEPTHQSFRALLAPSPGEQHTFGIFIVEQMFRHDGWLVEMAPELSTTELSEMVAGEWYTLLGLSMSCSRFAGKLAVTIDRVRQASLNPDLRILVGGHAFLSDPDLAAEVGADAMATDGRDAILKANALPLAPVRLA